MHWPSSGGIVGFKPSSLMSMCSSNFNWPREAGIDPPNELLKSSRTRSVEMDPRIGGIPPVRMFDLRRRSRSFKFARDSGMSPWNELEERLRY